LSAPESGYVSQTRHRVAMVDVDLVQINFTAYFRWMDLGYVQLLSDLGHPLSELLASGMGTPVVDARCNYLAPVGLDDVVDARTWVSNVGRSSYLVNHEFVCRGTPVARGVLKHVWIGLQPQQSLSAPEWLRSAAVTD
jgi:YbgC/YbaW family acyl-CoA thioester hydrolase